MSHCKRSVHPLLDELASLRSGRLWAHFQREIRQFGWVSRQVASSDGADMTHAIALMGS